MATEVHLSDQRGRVLAALEDANEGLLALALRSRNSTRSHCFTRIGSPCPSMATTLAALPGHRFTVIALDGNPVSTPTAVDVLRLDVAERADVIVEDASGQSLVRFGA
jgi:hypothetical protein